MKKLLVITLVVVTCTVLAAAQDVYSVNYYSNRNAFDSMVRVINPGTQGTPLTPTTQGTICADIYVFDADQEMIECCSCPITANGLLQLSLWGNLTQNPLTGFPAPNDGVIKIVSDTTDNCNAQAPTPVPELLAWGTHVQPFGRLGYVMTEEQFIFAPLAADELTFLGQACSFVQYLGSGKGVCTCDGLD